MRTRPHALEAMARVAVDSAMALAHRRVAVALIGLALTLLIAASYVVVVGLRLNPAHPHITLRVQLSQSGGLLPNQDVTLRGFPIGRIQSIHLTDHGVTAIARIDDGIRIPQNTTVHVSALTAAGEQYLDFRPSSDHGPFLVDGSTIGQERTSTPVPFHQLLGHAEGLLDQVDPGKVDTIIKELHVGADGPKKLQAIVDGGIFLISTLDSVLPETVNTIRHGRTVLTTMVDTRGGLDQTIKGVNQILAGVNSMDGGFRRLVSTGNAPLEQLDAIVADNSETMVQLLGNLTTVAQLSYVRVPALQALFPADRPSALEGLASTLRDGGIWALVDPYPRYSCDYKLPRLPASQPDFPEPYRYTYCDNPDPSVLIRGARNAPRPPGDDTAGPPPGHDPLATTDPTPVGPHSVPTNLGGPPLPIQPPS